MTGDARREPPALALASITRRFGPVIALDDVSLTVRPGTVHALLGENGAGKTTLMRVAYGMMRPDSGSVAVGGVVHTLRSPADAIAAGIGMVHQHFTLVHAMTVGENLALGGHGRYSARDTARLVGDVSRATGFSLDASAIAGGLPVGAQQRVEIAKAVARDARVLVLDEPTGVLAPPEIGDLLRWLRAYAAGGRSVVLITHKLREALAIADDVSVLRRGALVWSGPATETNERALTTAMIGGTLDPSDHAHAGSAPARSGAAIVFRADRLTVHDGEGIPRVSAASFEVAAGELVGVVGVEGSGHRELLRVLAGRLPLAGGLLERPDDVGFVPEDRHRDGVLLDRTLAENVALRGAGAARGRIRWRVVRERTRALMHTFDVRAAGPGTPMRALSGGNQQKLVLARELGSVGGPPPEQHHAAPTPSAHHHDSAYRTTTPPAGIVVENPTRGLDVRAAASVRARLQDAAADGAAVVIYSSDLDEVLGLATRVLVVVAGAVHALPPDRDAIGRAMLGVE